MLLFAFCSTIFTIEFLSVLAVVRIIILLVVEVNTAFWDVSSRTLLRSWLA